MSGNFKKRVILGGLNFPESLTVWAAGALAVISVILAIWASFSRAGGATGPDGSANPTPTPTVSAGLTPTAVVSAAEALEPFFSTDGAEIVLLVGDTSSLTDTELRWLGDILMQIGPAETLGYSGVTVESLAQYLTIFVIDDNSSLDVAALAESAAAGATVHLIGDAARYAAQVIPGGGNR